MSSREITEELCRICRQAWRPLSLRNQMPPQEECQIIGSHIQMIPLEVACQIKSYLREDPWIFPRGIRERLIQEGICDELTAPNISAISQYMQHCHPEHIPFRDESRDDRRDPTTAVASSGPLQALEQVASRGTRDSSQDSQTPVLSADQQQQQHHVRQWFEQQKILMLQRQRQAAIAAQQQQVQSVMQERERLFEQDKQIIAVQKEQAAAAKIAMVKEHQIGAVPPGGQWESVELDRPLKNQSSTRSIEEKSFVAGMNGGIDVKAGASVDCQADTQTDLCAWLTLDDTKHSTTSRVMKMMRTASQTTDRVGADESILASNTEKQEQTNNIDPSSKNSLKHETLMAELTLKDQRLFQIDIERRVDELSSAVGELRLKTTHLESEKSRLEKEIRDLKSQLHQQCLDSSDSSRDGIISEASESSSDDVSSLSRHEKAVTSIAACLSNPWGILPEEAEKITTDVKSNRKPLEYVDEITAGIKKLRKTFEKCATICESKKLQTFVQREDEEKRKKDLVGAKDREDELKKEISDLKMQMNLDKVKYIRAQLEWDVEREKLQKKLQHYESISQKGPIETLSTQMTSVEQKIQEDFTTSLQDSNTHTEKATKCSQNTLRTFEQSESFSASSSVAPEQESLKTIPPIPPVVKDHARGNLRRKLMSLVTEHNCKDLDCSITSFENKIKHANDCAAGSECDWYICKDVHARIEHSKVCDGKSQCKLCHPNIYPDAMWLLKRGCGTSNKNRHYLCAFSIKAIVYLAVQAAVYNCGLVRDCEKTINAETPQMGEISIDAESSDSSSDAAETSGWEIVKSESCSEVLV